jgi:hypothetical protein
MAGYFDRDEYNRLIEKYNYKEMLHDAFKHVIAPQFKEHGFTKRGKTFYREREGRIEICQVQYSSGNHRTTASFTYNIRIAVPYLYSKLGIEENKFDTIICGLRFGDVVEWVYNLPAFGDYWYELEACTPERSTPIYPEEVNEADIAKQEAFDLHWGSRYNVKTGEGFHEVLVEDIENIILPFFQSIPDAESLIKHLEQDEPDGYPDEDMMFQVGLLYYENGDEEKGRAILKKIQNGFYKIQIGYKIESGEILL